MRPLVGVVERVERVVAEPSAPQLEIAAASLGELGHTWPGVTSAEGGGGADTDPEPAWVRALVEAVERYCSLVHDERRVLRETADALGGAALDLTRLPALSQRELADPACPLRPPRGDVPIRWLPGFSLTARKPRYVPLALTHLSAALEPDERFALQITTGIAAHTDLAAALVAALCEVVERDAIALTWLARLRLPEIELDAVRGDALRAVLAALGRSTLRMRFYDATTDLGVPTVYAVALLDGDPRLAQTVSCATGFDVEALLVKNVREAVPVRTTLRRAPPPPADVRDFGSLVDGALALGAPAARGAFAFLLEPERERRPLSGLSEPGPGEARAQLAFLIARLRALANRRRRGRPRDRRSPARRPARRARRDHRPDADQPPPPGALPGHAAALRVPLAGGVRRAERGRREPRAAAVRVRALIVADGRFGRAVAAHAPPGVAWTALPGDGELPPALAGCERFALVSWRADHALFERADALAYRLGCAWSAVYLDGRYVCAGPAVAPPHGPCFGCFRRRYLTHHRAPERDLALSAAYARERGLGAAGFAPGAVLLAAAALDAFFAGAQPNGRFTRTDVLGDGVRRHAGRPGARLSALRRAAGRRGGVPRGGRGARAVSAPRPALVGAGWIGERFAADPALAGPERPRVIPELVIEPFGADGLLFEGARDAQVVRGRAARTVLPRILPWLDGTRTVAEIQAAHPALAPRAIRNLVLLLYSRGLLEDGAPDPPAGRDPDLDAYLGRFADVTRANRNRGEAWARLDAVRFEVVADGPAAAPLIDALRAAGLQASFATELGPAAFGPGAFGLLAATDPATDLGPAFAAAARAGRWALHLRVGAGETQLGPLFVPGRTLCYPCFVRQHGVPSGVPARAQVLFGLGLAASAALNLAARCAYPPVYERLDRYAAGPHGVERESVPAPRVPGCAACGIAGAALEPGSAAFAAWARHTTVAMPPPELADPRAYQEHFRQSNVEAAGEPFEPWHGAPVQPLPRPAWSAPPASAEPAPQTPLARLAELLLAAGGERPDGDGLRYAPSGGNLKSPELYLAALDLPGLAAGTYRYDAARHALERIGPLDPRVPGLWPPGTAPAVLVAGAGRLAKVFAKYERFAAELVALDAGVVLAYLHLLAGARRLALHELPDLPDALLADLLRIPVLGERSVPTFALALGRAPSARAAVELPGLPRAIVARRSARGFTNRSIALERLAALARTADRVLAARRAAGGFVPELRTFFGLRADAAHDAGVYRYDAATGALLLHRRGFGDAEAARCVPQRNLRSATALAFVVGDLRAAFAARGAGGYPALVTAAGSAVGALALAAAAAGIGACAYGGLVEAAVRDLLPELDGFNGCVLFGAALGHPLGGDESSAS